MNKKERITVCPSVLSADFAHLARDVQEMEQAGADALHLDIMDGHFVPNISYGPAIVSALNRCTTLPLDVHLMIYNPYDYIERFVEAGADRITIHFEATEDIEDTLSFIRRCNIKAGLAFNPDTSESMILRFLDKCDMILLMTVQPGFGGQEFIPSVLEKIQFTRQMCDKLGVREGGVSVNEDSPAEHRRLLPFPIQVDGGINQETGQLCVDAGASVLVSGTHLFGATDKRAAIEDLKAIQPKVVEKE